MSAVLQFAAHILIFLFLFGLAGSLIVIGITFIEDLELLIADEESTEASVKLSVIHIRIADRVKPAVGAVLCGALAIAVSLLGHSKPGKAALPIWFLAAVMMVVFRFWVNGRSVGNHTLRNHFCGMPIRSSRPFRCSRCRSEEQSDVDDPCGFGAFNFRASTPE